MTRRILGILCLLLAFVAGVQKNMVWGLLNFLIFFVTGITLLRESFRRKQKDERTDENK